MTWQDSSDAEPAIYVVWLELPDGRWWVADVQANTFREAEATVRRSARLPDAPLLICDRSSVPIPARVLEAGIVTPRGWEAGR